GAAVRRRLSDHPAERADRARGRIRVRDRRRRDRLCRKQGHPLRAVDLLQRLKRGEAVDPALIYCRTTPRFETGHDKYRWLMEHLFVASVARYAERVVIDVHQVL